MAVGFPTKSNWAAGDILTAAQMDDLAGTVNLLQNSAYPNVAGKNTLINGGMEIWQRGTTFSAAGYTSDRWSGSNSTGTLSITRSTDVPSSPKFTYSLSLANTSGTYPQINQRIEAANSTILAGQSVTLSFYAKSTAGSNAVYWISSYAGSADNWSSPTNDQSGSMTITSSWARYSATFTASSNASNGYQILVGRQDASTVTSTTLITGIQLELGSVATSFSRNASTYQTELAACQRYYYRVTAGTSYGAVSLIGSAQSTTTANFQMPLKASMRIAPTSVEYSNIFINDGANLISAGTLVVSGLINPENGGVTSTTTTLTAFRPYFLCGNNNTAGYLALSAEL
jgi:hypothetical protein